MSKKKKVLLIVIPIILIVVLVIAPLGISYGLYQSVFGLRYTSNPDQIRKLEYFSGLQRDRYEIKSNDGQTLVGYNYYFEDKEDIKGVVIFSHGIGGGGHNSYMDFLYSLAQHDYYVFAYDATGNDESEGDSVEGLPQGVIDLDHVITFVEQQDEFKDLPIGLMGHSWGGYCIASVLNEHPEVECVVSFAGFSKSSDLLEAQGKEMVGPVIYAFLPYMNLMERVKFGNYASQTGLEGFEKANAKVLIFHGGKDDTVPKDYGYDLYYEKFANDPNFEFVFAENLGHNNILGESNVVKAIDFFEENLNKS